MKWTSLNDLREKYLSFFESKGHLRLPSFSLVPHGDKSLLLINSGMAPMKKYFTGEETPPCRRVTTCQKCIRTPDLERVGHTARHGTYFEMLGNFSFGDYFKKEAIPWAWEFLTQWLEIPAERLYPSIYEEDDEAFDIWTRVVGVPAERVTRLGKEDNFWEHGSGPCGPCSEIYFDRGERYGCGSPDCGPGCDCDRFMEIWNNVFSQFNNDGAGHYTELAQKNIDTGMGLERLACVMQGVDNLFEVDTVRSILDRVCSIAGKKYGENAKDDISIRVVTDHIRSATFMIADGVIPSNEGRGYVLRRILRRASRHGKLLGIERPFLPELCCVVIAQNEKAYPEVKEKKEYILKVISLEEERFHATLDSGLAILSGMIDRVRAAGGDCLGGEDAFRLYDTFGFPVDLTREIAAEAGLSLDEEGFTHRMEEQRVRAREARADISGWAGTTGSLLSGIEKTEFVGYEENTATATVCAIIAEGQRVEEIGEGECDIILDRTPFYGEGGGQVGDTGSITAPGLTLEVLDTKKTDGVYVHICRVTDGEVRVGMTVTAAIDAARREAIRRNHSACHLLQAALRRVLGTHVEQAGSYVSADRCRFDFSHYSPMTAEEIAETERLVNEAILVAEASETVVTDQKTAREMGAMALFGEKYGDRVRVVRIGHTSTELCGGTHVRNTGAIGLFRIVGESSVAAGVRRIEAVTGTGVLSLLGAREETLTAACREVRAGSYGDLLHRIGALQGELRECRRALDAAEAKLSGAALEGLLKNARQVGDVRLVTGRLDMPIDAARKLTDDIRAKYPDMVAVFAVLHDGRLNFVACCGADAVAHGAHAGNIVRTVAAVTGGNGGGRPDSAVSGGKDVTRIDEALGAVDDCLKK